MTALKVFSDSHHYQGTLWRHPVYGFGLPDAQQ